MLLFLHKGSQDKANFKMAIKMPFLSDCGLKLKRPCLMFVLNSNFLYLQIKYALKAPHQQEGEDAQSVRGHVWSLPHPRTATSEELCGHR